MPPDVQREVSCSPANTRELLRPTYVDGFTRFHAAPVRRGAAEAEESLSRVWEGV